MFVRLEKVQSRRQSAGEVRVNRDLVKMIEPGDQSGTSRVTLTTGDTLHVHGTPDAIEQAFADPPSPEASASAEATADKPAGKAKAKTEGGSK